MNSRAIATIALGAAVMLGASGCSMISPQATKIAYSAAEGINIPDTAGPVLIRNAFLVVNDEGSANLIGEFINNSNEDQTVKIQIDGLPQVLTLNVSASSVVSLGHDADAEVVVDKLPVVAGKYVPVYFASGDSQGTRTDIPVLDGTLHYLEQYVPTPGA